MSAPELLPEGRAQTTESHPMTDITPENVARILEGLRTPGVDVGGREFVADILEALAARLAEVEAERDKIAVTVVNLSEQRKAAEAENAKLREALSIAGPIALEDFAKHPFCYNDDERRKIAIIRAALQENSHE
jgi:hypothetical protein